MIWYSMTGHLARAGSVWPALQGSNKWLSNLILNGSYSDFTPEW